MNGVHTPVCDCNFICHFCCSLLTRDESVESQSLFTLNCHPRMWTWVGLWAIAFTVSPALRQFLKNYSRIIYIYIISLVEIVRWEFIILVFTIIKIAHYIIINVIYTFYSVIWLRIIGILVRVWGIYVNSIRKIIAFSSIDYTIYMCVCVFTYMCVCI